jgi:uncharacterized protein YraI
MRRNVFLTLVLLLMIGATIYAQGVSITAYTLTRVRSGPGTEYSIIGVILEGDSYTANGRDSTSNRWLRVDYNGTEGWIAASVVTVTGDPTTLEVVSPSNSQITRGNTGITATVGDETTNIRFGPSTDYRVITQAEAGSIFDVTGRTSIDFPLVCRGSRIFNLDDEGEVENLWLRIDYGGFDAWISYSVVSVDGNLCEVEVAGFERPDVELPEFAGRIVVVTRENVNLRASNYPTSEILDTVPYNTTLYPDARNEEGTRLRVSYNDQSGWLSATYIDVLAGTIENLPVEEE